jgi:two-component system nitrogen regulation response regulator NtrX
MRTKVLVVDDEEPIRNLLKSRLEREGCDVTLATSGDEAMAVFQKDSSIGVVVTDLKMPGKDGLAVLKEVTAKNPQARVIMITGHGDKEVAVKALRSGAADYLEKPFDMDELAHSVRRCARENALARENTDLVSRLEARIERVEGKNEDQYWFVSKDPAMAPVNEWMTVLRREAMRGGAEEPSVVIYGESGTGKEGVARMIHAGSRRGRGPWIAVNCANFSEQLLESELFGHEKGAFTGANSMKRGLFEIAQGGTLFLDEIGEMDIKVQARLLRVLQEKTYRRVGGTTDLHSDVRVIAATHRNLKECVGQGTFREDLYHRFAKIEVTLPALRDRKEDILLMANQFAERAFQARAKRFPGFAGDAVDAMYAYSWPGNVRELVNLVERTAITYDGSGSISGRSLSLPTTGTRTGGPRLEVIEGGGQTTPTLTRIEVGPEGYMLMKKKWGLAFEREYLVSTLAKHLGNVSAAAREAKLDRSNFLRLLRRHRLSAQEYRRGGAAASAATGTDMPMPATGTDQTKAA